MTVTYEGKVFELQGFPGLAVRAGRALEEWGARAARPDNRDELRRKRQLQLEAQAAFEARQNGCFGIGTVLR